MLSSVWAREDPSDCDAADALDADLPERGLRGAADSRTFDDILPTETTILNVAGFSSLAQTPEYAKKAILTYESSRVEF